jgi:hypothetical protein
LPTSNNSSEKGEAMDDYICCLLGICCPPATAEQFEKLVGMMMRLPKFEGKRAAAEARVRKDLDWAAEHRETWGA